MPVAAVSVATAPRSKKSIPSNVSESLLIHTSLFTHRFNDDAFGTLSVELGVIDLLPGAEIELAFGHRHDDLVMHQKTLQVRIPVGFASAVVPVIRAKRRQFFQPFV